MRREDVPERDQRGAARGVRGLQEVLWQRQRQAADPRVRLYLIIVTIHANV